MGGRMWAGVGTATGCISLFLFQAGGSLLKRVNIAIGWILNNVSHSLSLF